MDPKLTMNDTAETNLNQNSAKAGVTAPLAGSIAFGATMYGPKPVFAPADGGGTSAQTPAAPAPSGGEPAAPAEPTPQVPANSTPSKPGLHARPAYLPKELWDETAGFKADVYNELVAFKANRDAELAQVPNSPDKYEARLPATFELPEGERIPIADDPRIQFLREVAHQQHWSQADFEDVLAMGVNMDIAQNKELAEFAAAEREKLGSRGAERIKAVTTFLDAKIGPELAGSLHGMMFTAKQVKAFEALQRLVRGDVRGSPSGGRDATAQEIPDEEYENMSVTQRINYARGISDGNH
ncbi:hypothetical protein [Brucella anthropi]|uniref:hypothetical protein n=1 Tax=Brucella anthropi TaxID=529 RepID=UPI00124ECED4|nr:hypothetical protein [Brucella anthropi]KAB2725663.1 hypothetical protein F9K76_12830 [Brucella anthropi]KAB2742974.1 hypothetical protein F9K74_12775 [Brucella anthropi]KAB2803795.1 hypothetical protein F9K83_12775 [Brucella anthropi]